MCVERDPGSIACAQANNRRRDAARDVGEASGGTVERSRAGLSGPRCEVDALLLLGGRLLRLGGGLFFLVVGRGGRLFASAFLFCPLPLGGGLRGLPLFFLVLDLLFFGLFALLLGLLRLLHRVRILLRRLLVVLLGAPGGLAVARALALRLLVCADAG